MKVIIRYAKIEDAPILAQAEREIAKTPGYFCSQPFELTDEQVQKTIALCLQTKKGVFFVAEYDGNIVGHACLEPFSSRSLSHIAELNIAVHEGW